MECNFSSVQGTLKVPSSKSYTQRALVGALLHPGITDVLSPGHSDDEKAVLRIIRGQSLTEEIPDGWRIRSTGKYNFSGVWDCGESGLAARLLGSVAALSPERLTLTGSGSLLQRPMGFFRSVLSALGVQVSYSGQAPMLPLFVQGPMTTTDITVDGSMSSQFISGLLFAFAFSTNKKVYIDVHNPVSTPYLQMTCALLASFGRPVVQTESNRFEIDPARFRIPEKVEIQVESDWSSAAFWICAAAIKGSIRLEGLQENSLQADRHLLQVLRQVGTSYCFSGNVLEVRAVGHSPFETNLTDCPDLFPVLSVLAAHCKGSSRLTGLHRLQYKESDRAAAICSLLRQLSVSFNVAGDTLIVEGGNPVPERYLEVPADHRMVMAAALAAMFSPTGVHISNPESVSKSYPEFFEHLRLLSISGK